MSVHGHGVRPDVRRLMAGEQARSSHTRHDARAPQGGPKGTMVGGLDTGDHMRHDSCHSKRAEGRATGEAAPGLQCPGASA